MDVPTARVRPVAIPDDLGGLDGDPLRGEVDLPRHVRWSGPAVTYDLGDRAHRRSVYEQVMREGTVEDVTRYIRLSDLIELWEELYLPGNVRRAWARRLREERGIDLRC
ncbi:MAG: hypothetical protein M3O70_05090 [Actinomycetota bacterium]|nr:hypothetical protein [Actinomycetota bacterium]